MSQARQEIILSYKPNDNVKKTMFYRDYGQVSIVTETHKGNLSFLATMNAQASSTQKRRITFDLEFKSNGEKEMFKTFLIDREIRDALIMVDNMIVKHPHLWDTIKNAQQFFIGFLEHPLSAGIVVRSLTENEINPFMRQLGLG